MNGPWATWFLYIIICSEVGLKKHARMSKTPESCNLLRPHRNIKFLGRHDCKPCDLANACVWYRQKSE